MTVYRVGSEGATVVDSDGREIARLPAGTIVIPGTKEAATERNQRAKRLGSYDDKMLRPSADAKTPPPERGAC